MLNFENLKVYSIKERKNLVKLEQFATLVKPSKEFKFFFQSLPKILCASDLNSVINLIVKAHTDKRQIGLAIGAHVVKCGLAPIIIDLMERGIITCVSMHGAVAIHDYEISLIGETSEAVAEGIEAGTFGMARETAKAFQIASKIGSDNKSGLGKALGDKILKDNNPYANYSILAAGARLNIPITVHVAIGTDIVHMHPNISGEDIGGSSYIDFKILAEFVSQLTNGVWLNIGSAVIMPEVFLKALTVANNLCDMVDNFTTVNMDMLRQYRAETNVVKRPTNKGYSLIGHHEIMVPLLYMGILCELEID